MAHRGRISRLLAVTALTAVAGCGSAAAPSAVHVQGTQRTQQIYVSPVTSAGAAVPGYRITAHAAGALCESGSEAVGQAYRCSAGNYLYDPCWAEKAAAPTVLCLASPWLHIVTALRLDTPLAALAHVPVEAGEPWGLRLAGGQQCDLAQGAHNVFRGQVIDYYCPAGLALLRGLNRKPATWTARSVLIKPGKLVGGPVEQIQIAWYGSPDRYH